MDYRLINIDPLAPPPPPRVISDNSRSRPVPTPRPRGVHTKHLTELDRFRVRTLYYDAMMSKARIRKITGYSTSQIRTAVRAKSACIGKRPGRPKKRARESATSGRRALTPTGSEASAQLMQQARDYFAAQEGSASQGGEADEAAGSDDDGGSDEDEEIEPDQEREQESEDDLEQELEQELERGLERGRGRERESEQEPLEHGQGPNWEIIREGGGGEGDTLPDAPATTSSTPPSQTPAPSSELTCRSTSSTTTMTTITATTTAAAAAITTTGVPLATAAPKTGTETETATIERTAAPRRGPGFVDLPASVRAHIWRSALSTSPTQTAPSRRWAVAVLPGPPWLELGMTPPAHARAPLLENPPWERYVEARHVPATVLARVCREARAVVLERFTPVLVSRPGGGGGGAGGETGGIPPLVWIDRHGDVIHFFGERFRFELFEMAGRSAWPELYE